jgi:murein DD-endopeptidase MepM/ murein hydrolase activator NlpD
MRTRSPAAGTRPVDQVAGFDHAPLAALTTDGCAQNNGIPCGTPLVAARGGRVKFAGSQSRAGNYIVIDGDKTGRDYAYMHLRDPALLRTGDRVATGQLIGYVGKTGDATACHLHFEIWTAPGWYSGGRPVDPLATLQSWDQAAGARRR